MEDDEGDELDRWLDEFGIDLPEVDDGPGTMCRREPMRGIGND